MSDHDESGFEPLMPPDGQSNAGASLERIVIRAYEAMIDGITAESVHRLTDAAGHLARSGDMYHADEAWHILQVFDNAGIEQTIDTAELHAEARRIKLQLLFNAGYTLDDSDVTDIADTTDVWRDAAPEGAFGCDVILARMGDADAFGRAAAQYLRPDNPSTRLLGPIATARFVHTAMELSAIGTHDELPDQRHADRLITFAEELQRTILKSHDPVTAACRLGYAIVKPLMNVPRATKAQRTRLAEIETDMYAVLLRSTEPLPHKSFMDDPKLSLLLRSLVARGYVNPLLRERTLAVVEDLYAAGKIHNRDCRTISGWVERLEKPRTAS